MRDKVKSLYFYYHNTYITNNFDRVVTQNEETHKVIWSFNPSITLFFRSWEKFGIHISICSTPITTKYDKLVTYHEGFNPWIHITLNMWLPGVMWQTKNIISLLLQWRWPPNLSPWRFWAAEILQINLHDPSMKWSCEVTWQINYIISPFAENPWTRSWVRCWLTARGSHS